MTIKVSEYRIHYDGQRSYESKKASKWLLPKEKLDQIAKCLEEAAKIIGLNRQKISDEDLPELQNYCFRVVYEMCERTMIDTLQKMGDVISGLTDTSGNTVLSLYVQKENTNKIKEIVNADLTQVLSKGETPLHVAVKLSKNRDYLNSMKDCGFGQPENVDHKGRMPVHLAVKKGLADVIEVLQPIADGHTILNIPYHSKHNLELCPFALSVLKGHISCLDELKKLGKLDLASVRVGAEKMTLLHFAIYANQFEMLKHLLTHYFEETKPLLNVSNSKGHTPLILGTILGDCQAISLLIEKGACIENRDFLGRTAVHYAFSTKQRAVIHILAAYGAQLNPHDLSNKTPLQLIEEEEKTFKIAVNTLIKNCEQGRRNKEVNFILNPPENLVFKGGGPKGIAYIGAIKTLEKRKMLDQVKRVAGTSAGGMTAFFLAIGCNSEEAENLLIETSGEYFLDHPFTEEGTNADHSDITLLNKTYETITQCIRDASPIPTLKTLGLELAQKLWTCTGICEGKRFLNWIEEHISTKTGIRHCTFGELADLIAKGKTNPEGRPFKHLHVYATRIVGKSVEIVRFSSEDFASKNLIISEAIRATISIPIVFKPHILIYKKPFEGGKIQYHTENKTFMSFNYDDLMKSLQATKHISEASHIDGGLIYNFPMTAFDQRGYIHHGVPEAEKKYHQFNRRTLGFSLYTANETEVPHVGSIENIGQLLMGVCLVFRHAETLIDKIDCDPRDKDRVIALNNQGISLLDFKTNPMAGKGALAIDEAEKTTEDFFKIQEKKFQRVVRSSKKLDVKRKVSSVAKPIIQKKLMTEDKAKEILTLGEKAQFHITACNALRGAETALVTVASLYIVTIPLVGIVLHYRYEEPKSLKSRKLELLSLDNERFALFEHIGKGDYEAALTIFSKHKSFFTALMKTKVFSATLKKCLMNCDNKFYRWDSNYNDPIRYKNYLFFFQRKTKIIPKLISREILYNLPDL